MANDEFERPLNEEEAKLQIKLASELMERSINISVGSCMYLAGFMVRRIVKEGWSPAYPDPTPEQEVEFLDRIISGLPAEAIVRPHPAHEGIADIVFPEGVKLIDVGSLYPKDYTLPANPDGVHVYRKFQSDWYPVPDFANYEINSEGDIRNRHTHRVLDVVESNGVKYVEVDDNEGFAHILSVSHQLKVVFGI